MVVVAAAIEQGAQEQAFISSQRKDSVGSVGTNTDDTERRFQAVNRAVIMARHAIAAR